MATFGALQTAVSKRLLDASNTAVSASDVASAINETIAYWKFRRFWFNEIQDQVTLTAQDAVIPYTGAILVWNSENGSANIEYSNMRYQLTKINQQDYNNLWLGNGYGIPQYYARVGQHYVMYPLPDRNYTLNRTYLKEYDALVDASDTNDFTNYAERLVRLWTVADLIAEFRQDEKMESYFRNSANDAYRQLSVMSDKSDGSGSLSLNSALL